MSAERPREVLARYVDLSRPRIGPGELLAALWADQLEAFAALARQGSFLPLRYDELMRDREAAMVRLFRHCRLPLDGVARSLSAFDEDSQAGTVVARKAGRPGFTDADRAACLETLARNPRRADPDLLLVS